MKNDKLRFGPGIGPQQSEKPVLRFGPSKLAINISTEVKEKAGKALTEGSENLFEHSSATAVFHQETKDEDGRPLSLVFPRLSIASGEMQAVFQSVTDGLGGASSRLVNIDGITQSQAHLAAHGVQRAIEEALTSTPKVLTENLDEIQAFLEETIARKYLEMEKSIRGQKSKIRGSIFKELATTFSSVVLQDFEDEKVVNLFWAGDSPIVIITPEKIYTTTEHNSGESPVKHCLEAKNEGMPGKQKLNSTRLGFGKKVPLIILTATDGLIKFRSIENDGISQIRFLAQNLISSIRSATDSSAQDAVARLKTLYERTSHELDDTTLVVTFSGQDRADFSLFEPGKQTIEQI